MCSLQTWDKDGDGTGEFALHLRMIAALAFSPARDQLSSTGLTRCVTSSGTPTKRKPMIYWSIFDTHIGRFRRNAPRRALLFPIELWNMYHRTDAELPRSNNSVEGWHRSFPRSSLAIQYFENL